MASGLKVVRRVNPPVVRPGMKIGSVDAEHDDEFLFECFVDHPAVATCASLRSPGMIVAGRTGSGKTAVIRYIQNTQEETTTLDPFEMSLSYVSNSDTLRFVQAIGGDLDLLFLALWKHVLCIEFIRLRYKVTDEARSRNAFTKIVERFTTDARKRRSLAYLREWEGKFWITMDQNIKEIAEKYENKLSAEMRGEIDKFKAGGQYEKRLSTEKKSELVARARKIINSEQLADLGGVVDILAEQSGDDYGKKHYILIDGLDERWVDVSIRFRLIRSLIESLKSFRRITNLKILVALRSDILERVVQETGDLTFQREKFEDFFVRLKWSKVQLKEFVDKRIGLTFRRQYSAAAPVQFEDLFQHRVGQVDPFDYIIDRTLMRPRDVLTFVNACLEQAEGQTIVTASLIRRAEGEYSRIRRQALEYEWQSAFPQLSRLLDYLKQFRKTVVTFDEFCNKELIEDLALPMTEKRFDYDPLFEQAQALFTATGDPCVFARSALNILYRVGAVGLKPHPGDRFYYSHRDEPVFNTDSLAAGARIQIHAMLHRTLGLEGKRDT